MISINGEVVNDPLSEIQIPTGKKAIFVRLNVQPMTRYTDVGREERFDSTINIPAVCQGVRKLTGDNYETPQIRYYENYSEQPAVGGGTNKVFEPNFIEIKGKSLILDLTTQQGKEQYKFLMVHCLNQANSHVLGKKPEFVYLDMEKASKEANSKKQLKNKAIATAYNEDLVSDTLAIKIHRNLFKDGLTKAGTDDLVAAEDMSTLRNEISDFASAKPKEFLKMVNDANLGLRAEIKEAQDLGIIVHKNAQWEWDKTEKKWNNKVLTVVPVGEDALNELISYFVGDRKYGAKALDEMRNEIIIAKEKAKGNGGAK